MKNITLIGLVVFLGGCAVASPHNINGKYYMLGDKGCNRYKMLSDSRIMCGNKAGEETGYRDAMTDYDLQVYQNRVNQQNQQMVIPQIQRNQYTNTATNCYRSFGGGVMCNSNSVNY